MINNIKKLNTLVASVFGPEVENITEIWTSNAAVQKDIKELFASSGGGRIKKDPNAPKRGKSAYLFFCTALRDTVKTSLGADSKATDVTRELGARWNKLKASSKPADKKALSGFEVEAAEDKARYDNEKINYVPPVGEDVFDTKIKRRGGKKANKDGPKRAKSAYLFFCDANRDIVKSKDPSLKATEVTSELGRLWNVLKADKSRVDDVDRYISLAAADTARYEHEKANGVSNHAIKSDKAVKAVKTVKTVKKASPKKSRSKVDEEDELLEEEDVKSSKEKTSEGGFQLFSSQKRSEMKKDFPKMKASEITKKLNADWKVLSKDEQKQWKQSTSN